MSIPETIFWVAVCFAVFEGLCHLLSWYEHKKITKEKQDGKKTNNNI